MYRRLIRSLGVGNRPFLRARGWGIDYQESKNQQGYAQRGGMVTGQIEPCIIRGRCLIAAVLL